MRKMSAAAKAAAAAEAARPRNILGRLAANIGCNLSSIGDVEQLAGVNIQSNAERTALWWQFRDLFSGPPAATFAAVMDHCSKIALERIERGELCLIRTVHY